MYAGNEYVSTRYSGKSFDRLWGDVVAGWLVLGLVRLPHQECATMSENSAEAPRKSEQPAVGKRSGVQTSCDRVRVRYLGLYSFSDFVAWFRVRSQFLEAQLCSAENFSESLDWILGDWWDFTSPRGESELVYYLSLAEDCKPGTGRLNAHVSPADETCDTDKSVGSFNGEHAGHPCWWADLCAPPPQT